LVLAALLLFESLGAALYLSRLISALPGHDALVVVLILLRGVIGALQFTAGWMLAARRPPGVVLAQWAVVSSAVWVLLAVGFNLAPTAIYPWWRSQAASAYGLYAVVMLVILDRLAKKR